MSQGIVESSQGAGSQEQASEQNIPVRGRLVQRLMNAGASLPQFLTDLLTTQAMQVAGTEAAGFLIERNEQGILLKAVAHVRNDQAPAEIRQAALNEFSKLMTPFVEAGKDAVIQLSEPADTAEAQFCLVTLLRTDGQVEAVSGVITRCRDVDRAQQRLQAMQLVAGYFELYTMRRSLDQSRDAAAKHQHVLQLAGAVSTAEGFLSAGMNLCNELATRTAATRVGLGWLHGTTVKLKSLSHTEEFDKKQEMNIAMVRAMEECVDQEEIVQFSPEGQSTPNVTRAAQQLSRLNGGEEVLSLPLRSRGKIVGVVTLLFARGHKLDPRAATSLAVCAELLAPQLEDRFANDRWLLTKAGLSAKYTAELAVGPKHMTAKLVIAALITGIVFMCVYSPMYHVTAPFTLVPTNKRIMPAPYDGYIQSVNIKKGQSFKKGDVLLVMHTEELQDQLMQAESDANAHAEEARRDEADKKVAEALEEHYEEQSSDAQARVLQEKISHATIRAPFDGVVLSGDMEDKVDAAVKEGDEMFEVASKGTPLEAELLASERDIQSIQGDGTQKGHLATDALPGDTYNFHVTRVVPLANAVEGANVFKVYGTLDNPSETWRPGMKGEAKIDVGHRPMIWIWTHHLIEWLRLKLWM
jgi:biotin carboxyl carrier protein